MRRVLDWHFERYPLMRAQDVYKLVHQGVFGPGHIIKSEEKARQVLEQEFSEVRSRCCMQAVESVEPLSPSGDLIRVNLETLREVDTAVELVLKVLVESAAAVRADPGTMSKRLQQALEWCGDHLPGQADDLRQLADTAEADGFPALHHSEVYLTAYRPAYRVVRKELWAEVDPGGTATGECGLPRFSGTSD
ncbi:MAG: hypothetical protein JSU73_06335 [candidate division WOR-3 bacterium]|nr:MAG: hypothetical protein JSU73_06335 [candidate division WOR-3 bacterium]